MDGVRGSNSIMDFLLKALENDQIKFGVSYSISHFAKTDQEGSSHVQNNKLSLMNSLIREAEFPAPTPIPAKSWPLKDCDFVIVEKVMQRLEEKLAERARVALSSSSVAIATNTNRKVEDKVFHSASYNL
ncbi:hypothetical protein ACLOJK_006449 [Asimina triloba]